MSAEEFKNKFYHVEDGEPYIERGGFIYKVSYEDFAEAFANYKLIENDMNLNTGESKSSFEIKE